MNKKYDLLIKLLHEFIEEKNTTIKNAGKIEVLLDDLYKENDDIENYVNYFASYKPEGGEFLYNKNELIKFCRELLTIIDLEGNNIDGLNVKLSAKNLYPSPMQLLMGNGSTA